MRYQFVDCRWSLTDPDFGRRAYLDGHIPGATFLDVDRDLAGTPGDGGRHPLPSADDFARAAEAAAVGDAVFDFESWRGPLERGEPRAARAGFNPHERTGDTIDLDELRERLDEVVLVDARTPARFRGEANPFDRVPGRIPTALNAPWDEPLPELPDGELVAYCGSGITSCVTVHRLHLDGRDGRLYPGSWSEWEQHDELPRERE